MASIFLSFFQRNLMILLLRIQREYVMNAMYHYNANIYYFLLQSLDCQQDVVVHKHFEHRFQAIVI